MKAVAKFSLHRNYADLQLILAEIHTNGHIWMRVDDDRGRWLNTIYKIDRTTIERARPYYSYTRIEDYQIPPEGCTAPDQLDKLATMIHYAGERRPWRTVNNKNQELKFNTRELKILIGYEGEEQILFEKPEDRVKQVDFLGTTITIGANVMGCYNDTLYLGKVKKFKVGPQNTFAKVDTTLPRKHQEISMNIKSLVVVNPELGNNILLAKLTN